MNMYRGTILDQKNKVRKTTTGIFLYSTMVHELGHALGLPHIPNTTMHRRDQCFDTTSKFCVISDQLLFRFLDYYYPYSLSNALSRAKRIKISNKKTQSYRDCLSKVFPGLDCKNNHYGKATEPACRNAKTICKRKHPEGEKIYNSSRNIGITSGGCTGRCP